MNNPVSEYVLSWLTEDPGLRTISICISRDSTFEVSVEEKHTGLRGFYEHEDLSMAMNLAVQDYYKNRCGAI